MTRRDLRHDEGAVHPLLRAHQHGRVIGYETARHASAGPDAHIRYLEAGKPFKDELAVAAAIVQHAAHAVALAVNAPQRMRIALVLDTPGHPSGLHRHVEPPYRADGPVLQKLLRLRKLRIGGIHHGDPVRNLCGPLLAHKVRRFVEIGRERLFPKDRYAAIHRCHGYGVVHCVWQNGRGEQDPVAALARLLAAKEIAV